MCILMPLMQRQASEDSSSVIGRLALLALEASMVPVGREALSSMEAVPSMQTIAVEYLSLSMQVILFLGHRIKIEWLKKVRLEVDAGQSHA